MAEKMRCSTGEKPLVDVEGCVMASVHNQFDAMPWQREKPVCCGMKVREAEASEGRMAPGPIRRSNYAARITREEFFAQAPS